MWLLADGGVVVAVGCGVVAAVVCAVRCVLALHWLLILAAVGLVVGAVG